MDPSNNLHLQKPTKVSDSSYYYCTPFGAYCSICNKEIGDVNVNLSSLKSHHYRKNKNTSDNRHTLSISFEFQRNMICDKMKSLRQTTSINNWIIGSGEDHYIMWKCTCGVLFHNNHTAKRHLKKKFISDHVIMEVRMLKTTCKRFIDESMLRTSVSIENQTGDSERKSIKKVTLMLGMLVIVRSITLKEPT